MFTNKDFPLIRPDQGTGSYHPFLPEQLSSPESIGAQVPATEIGVYAPSHLLTPASKASETIDDNGDFRLGYDYHLTH
ncbi:hypothetical protein [Pontibacter sp. G13]|uniref:hypothetical protein n=1 Tax=Pontibacter sp. G13 TaxID=3074898 RepID=UPI00288A01E5|nr:hypothetical protein [Pontibacter sp. G13]WNJ17217.1 hypothetical protein RJD25_20365 [Pontibacter sp. G13]